MFNFSLNELNNFKFSFMIIFSHLYLIVIGVLYFNTKNY